MAYKKKSPVIEPVGKTLVSYDSPNIRPNSFYVQNYVARAEEIYEVKKYLQAQHKRHQHHFVRALWKHTRLSKQEIAWLLEMPVQTIKDTIAKEGTIVRDSSTKNANKQKYKGVMNPEFLRSVAVNGMHHFIETGEVTEEDIAKLQTDMTYKSIKMLELETSGMVSASTGKAYETHFKALKEGFALLKDAQGLLSTKDKKEFEIKEKLASIKIQQLELEKKGKNVAVTIIEEYGNNGVLADADLIYLVKDFLTKLGHTGEQVSMITKKAMATIHHRQGKLTDEEFTEIIENEETKLENIEL
ncbi:MAG: hypothetical protein ACRDCE_00895 [Cetobacterium sp.]|uniref:hypothetical protein n=1 Tax=Cetobacterium sp. TaxID=2071632 RepID=UPI003EE79066